MKSFEELHGDLQQLFRQMRDAKGESIDVKDLTDALGTIVQDMERTVSHEDGLLTELKGILAYIEKTKKDLSSPLSDIQESLLVSDASEELMAVVKTTEEATNRILDAAEGIQSSLADVDPEDARERINTASMEIIEACNFQDLTGQRLRKVIDTISYIEDRLRQLLGEAPLSADAAQKFRKSDRPDEDLMNGPGKLDETPTQDDIDAIFNNPDT